MEFIVAQILGVLGTACNVISMQLKKKEQILRCFILAGIFFTFNYLLLNGYTGAIVCMIATMQTIVSYILAKKEKEVPKWLIAIFFILSIIGGILTYQNIIDILPILGGITYTCSILQKEEKYIRWISLCNYVLWLIYDMFVRAYSTAISDSICIISTAIGIIRFDIMKNRIQKGENNE